GTPQLSQREAHTVAVLGLLAEPHAIRVGKDEHAVVAFDHASLAARVARQPCMSERVDVAREHPVAGFEARRRALGTTRAATLDQNLAHVSRPQDAERVGGRTAGPAGPG